MSWWLIIFICVFVVSVICLVWFVVLDHIQFRRAKKAIYRYVGMYKDRVKGDNRFLVSVPILQSIFVEFDTPTIEMVFDCLIDDGLIRRDPYDGEWCVR